MSKEFFKKLANQLKTPEKVQRYLRDLNYNHEKNGETLRSAFSAAQLKEAHCLEAALLAAAILEYKGFPPLVMSIESHDNLDHVIFVYQKNKKWGSVGRSRDEGLHGRKPLFKNLRSLAMSYYEPYIDKTGCITGYQIAHLDSTKADWRKSSKNVWKVEKYLIDLKHVEFKFNKQRYLRIHKKYLNGITAVKKPSWL
jgi:hypothetical protein